MTDTPFSRLVALLIHITVVASTATIIWLHVCDPALDQLECLVQTDGICISIDRD